MHFIKLPSDGNWKLQNLSQPCLVEISRATSKQLLLESLKQTKETPGKLFGYFGVMIGNSLKILLGALRTDKEIFGKAVLDFKVDGIIESLSNGVYISLSKEQLSIVTSTMEKFVLPLFDAFNIIMKKQMDNLLPLSPDVVFSTANTPTPLSLRLETFFQFANDRVLFGMCLKKAGSSMILKREVNDILIQSGVFLWSDDDRQARIRVSVVNNKEFQDKFESFEGQLPIK